MNPVIMPCRNNLWMTRDAVDDVLAQDIGDVHLFASNNGSTDNTPQFLAGLDPEQVTVVHYVPPTSVAKQWNRGLEWAFANGAAYALVINNDVRLRDDTYRLLVADGGGFVTAVGVSPESAKFHRGPLPETLATRPHPDFSNFLIRREAWEAVGPFDEGFSGSYCEDWDYHVRLHKAGVTAHCTDVPFLHYGAATIKTAPTNEAAAMSEQAQRNREYFFKKWGVRGASPEYYNLFGSQPPEASA